MSIQEGQPERSRPGKQVVVVGGGLVGSNAAVLVAKLEGVTSVRVIDGDTYAASNLRGQNIIPRDVGRPKADVLARRIREQSPGVCVEPICSWLEHVPRGLLLSDVVLGCLDSRRARCQLNEACWRLGVPLLDAGVDGAALLARANIYRPGPSAACLECSWNAADYAAMEQVYSCQPGRGDIPATDSSASLGYIAAGLLVNECQRMLHGDPDPEIGSRQVMWDCRNHRCLVTSYRRSQCCRFDHGIWNVEPVMLSPGLVTLSELLALSGAGGAVPVSMEVSGQRFVSRLVCPGCGASRDDCLYLTRKLASAAVSCRACGRDMAVSGFHASERLLYASALSRRHATRPLAGIGFRGGDILSVQYLGGQRHLQLMHVAANGEKDIETRGENCEGRTS